MKKTTILFLSWRDIKAPKKGGAEIYTHEMMKRSDLSRFRIIHFSPAFEDCKKEEEIDGILYLRRGGLISVIKEARKFYTENKEDIDFVVDQCNTHRFFTPLWVEREKRIFFIHQLTKEIWFRHMPFPFNLAGYLTESPFLKLSRNDNTITVSDSTKNDLLKLGFKKEKVQIVPEGIDFRHWDEEEFLPKETEPTFIFVGRYAKYKGIDATLEAFGMLKKEYPDARLLVLGKKNEEYLKKRLIPICNKHSLIYKDGQDVDFKGFVTDKEKLEYMSRSHCLVFPSMREGWGLIITEAAAVGTPSIVFDSAGTRDAVNQGEAGYLCEKNNTKAILARMREVIDNNETYTDTRKKAYDFSKGFHWDNTGKVFNEFITRIEESSHA